MKTVNTIEQASKRRTPAQWLRLIDGFAGSGLSVAQYCAQQRVSEPSFYRWRALVGEKRGRVAKRQPGRLVACSPAAKGFVDLGALDAVGSNASSPMPLRQAASQLVELRLELGAGVVLTITRS
jgi:putative transposase